MTAAHLAMLLIVSADTLTGDWGGARDELADLGLQFDFNLSGETYYVAPQGVTLPLGHLDLGITFDTGKAGLWPGGKFYLLGQAGVGDGVNEAVGSANEVSNLEARNFTQVAEAFIEQTFLSEKLRFRLGKQDANRDFGTPRYGGNFINNNFGMYPTAQLPSYPTTGLGLTGIVDPLEWLSIRGALYQGTPEVGHFGLDPKDGAMGVLGVAVKHVFGTRRHGGTTSLAAWAHTDGDWGLLFQNDERIYSHPDDPDDGRGLNWITRVSWTRYGPIPLYAGLSLAWHGLWARDNDTVGIGGGFFTLREGGEEIFLEVFYKCRLTRWLSVQPDLQLYRISGTLSFLSGLRLKLKL